MEYLGWAMLAEQVSKIKQQTARSHTMKSALLALTGLVGASNLGSPVEKVVELIQGILDRAVSDGESEQQIYDKYACWCDTTAKRKAAAITQAQTDMRRFGQEILALKGNIATLTSEIEELGAEIVQNEKDQALATSIREKENSEYEADTVERKQAIAAMEQAIGVLIKGTSFVQVSAETSSAVKKVIEILPTSMTVKPEHLSLLSEFASAGAHSGRFAPQSVTIQGILTDMYSTFVTDLEDSTQDEASANRKFEDYIYIKQVELGDLKATKLRKEGEKADAESLLADTTQAYDDTEDQKAADIDFFDVTKKACTEKNEEWVIRKKMRDQEVEGLKEALKILTSDEAREMFAKAIKPGKETFFLQTESESTAPVQHAYAILKKQATKAHSLRLAQLAVSVRNAKSGHFDKVIASINKIIQNLKDEEQADIDKRDECKDQYLEIESTIKDLSWKVEKNEAKIDKLEKLIEEHQEEKAQTIDSIEDVTDQMAGMKKQRKQENEAFLNAKKDDQAAIKLLEAARAALTKYYKKNKIEMGPVQGSVKLLQKPFAVSEDQAPDAVFSDKGSRKNESKGVVGLMSMLIEDLEDEIKNGLKDEAETQLEYEAEMKAAKKLKEELIEKKVNLEMTIAKREEDKSDEHSDMTKNMGERMDEQDYKAKIKPDCDWIIGSFKERETARAAEMNGLLTAKEYLAGAKVPSLLQKSKFNDDALSSIKFMGMK